MLVNRNDNSSRRVDVWAEKKKGGRGYVIYAGVYGTDIKTYAGSANTQNTLDYRLSIAQSKYLGRS